MNLFIVYVIAVYFFYKIYLHKRADPLLTFIIVLEKYTFIMTRIVPAFERNFCNTVILCYGHANKAYCCCCCCTFFFSTFEFLSYPYFDCLIFTNKGGD